MARRKSRTSRVSRRRGKRSRNSRVSRRGKRVRTSRVQKRSRSGRKSRVQKRSRTSRVQRRGKRSRTSRVLRRGGKPPYRPMRTRKDVDELVSTNAKMFRSGKKYDRNTGMMKPELKFPKIDGDKLWEAVQQDNSEIGKMVFYSAPDEDIAAPGGHLNQMKFLMEYFQTQVRLKKIHGDEQFSYINELLETYTGTERPWWKISGEDDPPANAEWYLKGDGSFSPRR